MEYPRFSIVIPAYNQAQFLPDAINSVLKQTFSDFEIIVVNDASQDNTIEVVETFIDPRVRLIIHEQNKGLPASRNTGMRAASGDLIALLDADDLFLPEKLQSHVDFLEKHPDIGVSYNAKFMLNHSANTIREIVRPPTEVGLLDLVLDFPFTPSDMVVRKKWAFRIGLFDESFVNGGEDTDFPCRLALAGCKFAGIDKVLNARRFHSGRKRKNLSARLQDVVRTLDATFNDPRCTPDVLAIKDKALKYHLMMLVSQAYIQEETALAHRFLRDLIAIDGSILEGNPSEFVKFLMDRCVADEKLNHEVLLKSIVYQLSDEYRWLAEQIDWAVTRGYLIKGVRAMLFDRIEAGQEYLLKAIQLKAQMDESYIRGLIYQWASYEKEFGASATHNVINNLMPYLQKLTDRNVARWLKGNYYIQKAFLDHKVDDYKNVSRNVFRGIVEDPSWLANRGVLSILYRSLTMQSVERFQSLVQGFTE